MSHTAPVRTNAPEDYFVPHNSSWPMVGCIGLALIAIGAGNWMNESSSGMWVMFAGIATILFMMFCWFKDVIGESLGNQYSFQMDRSFRQGMAWFIFSEVMFFGAFFGALFYARELSIPWLGGEGSNFSTNYFLWNNWEAVWPTNGPAELGGDFNAMAPWASHFNGLKTWVMESLPLVNTMILLTSGLTITYAHWGIFKNNNTQVVTGLFLTSALGCIFLFFQVEEYIHAYTQMNLTLASGIYGSTFFLLTGFHGMHVTLGTIMLIIAMFRAMKKHYTPESHFSFEAIAWYWHFVDVVWLGLFIFVYVM